MNDILFLPPLAFVIYVVLVSILSGMGRVFAGKAHPNPEKSSAYASGEVAPPNEAAPGYRPFFKIALFFAVLHLGVIVLGSGGVTSASLLYLVGLMLVLLALILG